MSPERESRRAADDEMLLDLLAAGWTHEEAAASVGLSSKTVQRRLQDGDFRLELAHRRARRAAELAARLSSATTRAVDVIIAGFDADSDVTRLKAADMALTWFARIRRDTDLDERMARLESGAHVSTDGVHDES